MNLQLSLKKNWFEMTKSGIKTEDYREITAYWIKRLFQNIILDRYSISQILVDLKYCKNNIDALCVINNWFLSFSKFETNTMTLGYPKTGDTERILKLEHKGIEIRTGNPERGAEPNKLYFVIKHGLVLK